MSVETHQHISPSQLLRQIDGSLSLVTQSLKSLQNEDEILLSIEQDSNLKLNTTSSKDEMLDLNTLNSKDNDITSKLDLCNKLWVLKGFIDQITTDLELNEFESIFYNLNKLQVKLKEFEKHYMSTLIIDKVGLQIVEFEKSLEFKINNLVNKQFWQFTDGSICFNKMVEVNEYSELTYEELSETLSTNYHNTMTQLNKKLLGYLNFNQQIDEVLIQPLIKDQFDLQITSTELSTKLEKIPKVDSIFNYTTSLIHCVIFINSLPNNKNLQNYIIKPILESLEKKLLEDNIELLMSDDNLKKIALELSNLLEDNGWFNKGENKLKNWVNDSITYWIDKKFKDSLEKIRIFKQELLMDDNIFQELSQVEKNEESWNWNDDEEEEEKEKERQKGDEDDGWDAWDNEEDDLFNENGELKTDDDKDHHQISGIPQRCYDQIILPFLNLSSQIKELNIEGLLVLRLKDLLTDIFIIFCELYQVKKYPILFCNDFQKLLELVNFTEISDSLNIQLNNFLELIMNEYKFKFIKIWNSTIRDFQELQDEEDDDDEIFLIEFNDYIKNLNEMVDLNFHVSSKITNLLLISNHSFILEFLIKKIFAMSIISEIASIKIANFQKSMIKIFKKTHNIEVTNLKNFNKFEKISNILNANLKKIELSFNDGEYFDFETEELVRLIELLFVESDLRNDLVQYIRDVRNEE